MSKLPTFFASVLALAIGLVLGECILFWNFTADDAYILMRYAMNLTKHGQWVYNINDYITAMTSPLHGIIEAILYFITRELPNTNKIISLLTFLIISVGGFRYFKGSKLAQLFFIVLFSTSPFVMLWTLGGLETPYLSLLLFLLIYLTSKLINEYSNKRIVLLAIVSGLCFICRYDAVLFMGWLFPFIFLKFGWKKAFKWGFIAAIIPAVWLLFSNYYYGDIFPTSFYEKHPNFENRAFLIQNINFILDFFVASGLLLLIIVLLIWSFTSKELRRKINNHLRNYWFAYLGLYAIFLYGTGTATVHMMFSYRMFVPYISVIAFVIAALVKQSESISISKLFAASLSATVVIVLASNLWFTNYISKTEINPCRNPWDYPRTSLTDYIVSQDIIEKSAEVINKHWKTQPQSATRAPRIITPAEGVVAYYNPDAYVLGYLVSYRKQYDFFQALGTADYFGNASVIPNPMIVNAAQQMKTIFDEASPVYGVQCHWYIYFKEGITAPNPIPNTINGTTRVKD